MRNKMEKKLYGFVVLHYLDLEMTKKCVDSIISNYREYNIKVAVVDNGSGNNSGERLRDLYKDNEKVTVLINKENMGFARGNNTGYHYLRKYYKPDYVVILNNDVIINQRNFLEKVNEIYFRIRYDVLGPDIYCPFTEKHQNPSRLIPLTKEDVKELYEILDERIKHYNKYYIKKVILTFTEGKKKNVNKQFIDYTKEYKDIVLHGACYIFSKKFIEICDTAFNPDTFLYLEEEILYLECKRRNFCMAYSPELCVKHYEDVSTKKAFRSDYKRDKMKIKNQLHSIRVLLDLMDSLEKKNDQN